jgi:NAD(P)-dependent dehydrogenase (short-subunit alcohol dehydrogenase family)
MGASWFSNRVAVLALGDSIVKRCIPNNDEELRMGKLKGKVAIVTGGASGIGEATAKLMAKEQAKVAIVDIDVENGKRVAGEINKLGGTASYWQADVSHENEIEKTFAGIYKKYGQLNILVNDAGVAGVAKPSHETTVEEWNEVMNTNLKGPFFCVKNAVPYMKKSGGGSVVNISSIMGMLGGPGPVYNASKGGLRILTKADALIYAKDNIRFNSIHPGYINTPLSRKLASESKSAQKAIKAETSAIPLGRMGLPEDIANGILFLASDDASYITGSELVIDGGKLVQ